MLGFNLDFPFGKKLKKIAKIIRTFMGNKYYIFNPFLANITNLYFLETSENLRPKQDEVSKICKSKTYTEILMLIFVNILYFCRFTIEDSYHRHITHASAHLQLWSQRNWND